MALYAIDISPTDALTCKSGSGAVTRPVRRQMQYCKDCGFYATSLELCGFGSELVHRHPYSGCLDGRSRE